MKAIDIFLRAIERAKHLEKGILISNSTSMKNSKFPAYTDMLLEVYEVIHNDGKRIPCKICTVSKSWNFTQEGYIQEAKKKAEDEMAEEAMLKIMEYYGI